MTLPEPNLQAAINQEVTGEGSEAMFARRLERNFVDLDQRLAKNEGTLRAQWLTVLSASGTFVNASGTNSYWLGYNEVFQDATAYAAAGLAIPLLYTANYTSTQWRIQVVAATNATSPAVTFTAHLYAVTSAGAAGNLAYTGSGGSLASVAVSPNASTVTGATGSSYTVATNFVGLIGVASSAPAANSVTALTAHLQVRNPS